MLFSWWCPYKIKKKKTCQHYSLTVRIFSAWFQPLTPVKSRWTIPLIAWFTMNVWPRCNNSLYNLQIELRMTGSSFIAKIEGSSIIMIISTASLIVNEAGGRLKLIPPPWCVIFSPYAPFLPFSPSFAFIVSFFPFAFLIFPITFLFLQHFSPFYLRIF
jgi:hypothetical protein